ncbi:hypothetical protein FVE85_8668 [Porphyridium purpureum]|uniref:Uncharacterized protein n=1 Tax=Porphyridium purpureum TaxID=35688 RepID=A0A5J4YR12_PORPP|nr:hypothetical protein FVE85_8668 [Porphyridium purpureum]|eukprot:POR2123..scf296_7
MPGIPLRSRVRRRAGLRTRSRPPAGEENEYDAGREMLAIIFDEFQRACDQLRLEENSSSFSNVAVSPVTLSSSGGQAELNIGSDDSVLTCAEECEMTEDEGAKEGNRPTKRPRTAEDLIDEFTMDQEVASIIGQLAANTVSVNPYDDDSIKEDSAPF